MADDDKNAPGGSGGDAPAPYAPLPPAGATAPGPSLADEERAMQAGGGRGTMIAAIVVFGLLALGGLVMILRSGGESEYSALGRALNGMRQEHFDSFWACALPRERIDNITGPEQLISEVQQRAHSSPHGYATLVNSQCMTHLTEHGPGIDALIEPPDMVAPVAALRAALTSLTTAWTAYLTYLQHLPGAYDLEDAEAVRLVTACARGWYDYRIAIGAVNDVVRTHVGGDD